MITEHRAPVGPAITIGRYLLHREIARGGMATVHLARLIGDEGFSRIVAAKRLHPELAMDHDFTEMFLAEARITSKLRHPNIVPVLDVVTSGSQIVLVQEYVHGAPLHWLLEQARLEARRVPIEIAVSIACQVLSGLHAAHMLTDELGQSLDVVHRDVSPQNVMIATDGTARLLDFGIAKTSAAVHRTKAGVFKGKIAYAAPEQVRGAAMPQSDVFSLTVMLWELLVGQRMYEPQSESELVVSVLNGKRPHMRETLWKKASSIPSETWAQLELLEPIVERGLSLSLADRWNTAEELEVALRAVVTPAPASAVASWLKHHGKEYLELHERAISAEESSWRARPVRRAVGSKPPENSGLRLLPSVGSRAPRASMKMIHAEEALAVSHGVAVPPAQPGPEWRGHGAVIAVLCGLIIAALAGIVLVMRASSQSAAPTLVPPSEPAQGIIFRPGVRPPGQSQAPRDARASASRVTAASGSAPATRAMVPRNRVEVAAPTPTNDARATVPRARVEVESPAQVKVATAQAKVAPAPAKVAPAQTKVAPEQVKIAPAAAPRSVVRAPDVRTVAKPRPAPAPAPAKQPMPAKAAAKPAAETVDCTLPYYYEGTKKHFKPACL